MLIENIQAGPYIDYSLAGNVLTIGEISIDLAAGQKDHQETLYVTRSGNTLIDGLDGANSYVASVAIPPKEYNNVDSGDVDYDGNPVINKVALPLDTDKVVLKLWQFKPVYTESSTI